MAHVHNPLRNFPLALTPEFFVCRISIGAQDGKGLSFGRVCCDRVGTFTCATAERLLIPGGAAAVFCLDEHVFHREFLGHQQHIADGRDVSSPAENGHVCVKLVESRRDEQADDERAETQQECLQTPEPLLVLMLRRQRWTSHAHCPPLLPSAEHRGCSHDSASRELDEYDKTTATATRDEDDKMG